MGIVVFVLLRQGTYGQKLLQPLLQTFNHPSFTVNYHHLQDISETSVAVFHACDRFRAPREEGESSELAALEESQVPRHSLATSHYTLQPRCRSASAARTTTPRARRASTVRSTWRSTPPTATSPWRTTLTAMTWRCPASQSSSRRAPMRSASTPRSRWPSRTSAAAGSCSRTSRSLTVTSG